MLKWAVFFLLLVLLSAAVGYDLRHPIVGALLSALVVGLLFSGFIWRYRWRRAQTLQREAERIALALDLGQLLAISPTQFEHTVASLLGAVGYTDVEVSGRSGDLSADIICRDSDGASVIVQCKQYAPSRRVGTPEVQTFIGMAFTHHGAAKSLYITTADYTKGARELAADHQIRLIDGHGLVDLARKVTDHGPITSSKASRPRRRGGSSWLGQPSP